MGYSLHMGGKMELGNGAKLTRKRNGTYVLHIEKSGIIAMKSFASYEKWREWAKQVLGRKVS
jgi:hypothetical protein